MTDIPVPEGGVDGLYRRRLRRKEPNAVAERPWYIPAELPAKLDNDDWRSADRYSPGHYILPVFDPSKPGMVDREQPGRTYQRVTTFIGMIDYKGDGLEDWKDGNLLDCLVHQPDLLQMAIENPAPDRRRQDSDEYKRLSAIRKRLLEEIRLRSPALMEGKFKGSQIHLATELIDLNQCTPATLPTSYEMEFEDWIWDVDLSVWRGHMEAYVALRDGPNGFITDPSLIERKGFSSRFQISGRFDRIVLVHIPGIDCPGRRGQCADGCTQESKKFRVLDVKSGNIGDERNKDKRSTIGRQELVYATFDALWNPDKDEYELLPEETDTTCGLIVEIPWFVEPGQSPTASLYVVHFDRLAGEDGLTACAEVKGLKRSGHLVPERAYASASYDPVKAQILAAESVPRLYEIHTEAKAAGTWKPDVHKPIATAKKNELAALVSV